MFFLEFKGKHSKIKGDESSNNPPIDIVVTWVDHTDKKWLEERERYLGNKSEECFIERYRDWDLMRYWFRAIEQYAPWARNIIFVTEGHIPSWLNTSNEKLRVIKHRDYIPSEYLPTFNSIPIELNFHRIEGLSEHFIYLNDDYFLNAPVSKTDFFEFGLPKYYAAAIPIKTWKNLTYYHHLFNNVSCINRNFDVRKCIDEHPERWFSKKYKDYIMFNRTVYISNYISGFYESHIPFNLRKSTLATLWKKEPELLHNSCTHKFRNPMDVQLLLVKWWDVMNGDYIPYALHEFPDAYFEDMRHESKEIEDVLNNDSILTMCLNDNGSISDEDYKAGKAILHDIFEKKYPQHSSFELD